MMVMVLWLVFRRCGGECTDTVGNDDVAVGDDDDYDDGTKATTLPPPLKTVVAVAGSSFSLLSVLL